MARQETALITGASTGIGKELAFLAAEDGCRLVLTAHEPEVDTVADDLRGRGVEVKTVIADLATAHGVEELWAAVDGQRIEYLLANAGRGLGDAFLEQSLERIEEVIHLNVTGTTSLVQRAARAMRDAGGGRILITGSLAGHIPGSYQAVYNATKAYIDTFSYGIRNELQDASVSVTCLMPGPVDTEFFHRADMGDTPVGQSESKADVEKVAREGWTAMKSGKSGVSPTFMTKLQSALSGVVPDSVLARLHRNMAEPEETSNG